MLDKLAKKNIIHWKKAANQKSVWQNTLTRSLNSNQDFYFSLPLLNCGEGFLWSNVLDVLKFWRVEVWYIQKATNNLNTSKHNNWKRFMNVILIEDEPPARS